MDESATALLTRIAESLERAWPPPSRSMDVNAADAFVWNAETRGLEPVEMLRAIPLSLLLGVDAQRDALLPNTRQFAQGFSGNNVLLWGTRGMGKSSLIKAVHAELLKEKPHCLALVEIHREDIAQLPALMRSLRGLPRRFIVFCDDLSFDGTDASYKSLKAALEGGIEGRPDNVLFYATSNRRHLMPREMIENERSTAINPAEAVEEKVSLSDRFGLWLGFHACSLDTYLSIVDAYAKYFGIQLPPEDLHQQAYLWASARGTRSGRVAWQFMLDLAGRLGKRMDAV